MRNQIIVLRHAVAGDAVLVERGRGGCDAISTSTTSLRIGPFSCGSRPCRQYVDSMPRRSRYRDVMDARNSLNRRQLFQLAGGIGMAASVGACSTTAAADPTVASAQLLCRDAWGARPARPGGRTHNITRMTLHHEAVVLGDNRNAPERLRADQRYHQDQKGWIDIAYHVGIDRDGNVYELRTPQLAGDTATDYDTTGHFLVLCEGDFDQEAVSEAQLQGAALAFAWATRTFHIASNTLAGHRDLAQTSCPGANLYAHLSSGDLKRRIDDLVAAGETDLQRICGPDAAARVAAIEAG